MDISTLKLFPDNLVKALCNTLIHSLWQGLLLAAITGLIIIFTRKSSSAKRYNLLIAALFLFAAATITTFVIEIGHVPVNTVNHSAYQEVTVTPHPVKFNNPIIQKTSLTDKTIGYFNNNAATIVLIWFLIVCARSLQLITGLQGLYHFRHKYVYPVDDYWQKRVEELALKLGIQQVVKIAESGLAKVPMVIGHLKPLILIPVGLCTALTTEEVEAILVHELAHIHRRDYLVNLLQSLMEIVFFFNPAVLWISALIRTERENCCDDIAVSQSSSKVNYIKALVSCQEYYTAAPAYAMALKGHKNHLMDRVKRMLSNSNHSLNRVEKSLLAICLVSAGLLTAAFSNAEKINKLVATTTKAIIHTSNTIKKEVSSKTEILKTNNSSAVNTIKKDSLFKKDSVIHHRLKIYNPDDIGDNTFLRIPNNVYSTCLYKEKGVLYQLNFYDNNLNSIQVNGKTIPAGKHAAYQDQIDKITSKYDQEPAEPTVPFAPAAPVNVNAQIKLLHRLDSINTRIKINSNIKLNGSLKPLNANVQKLAELRDMAISDSVNQIYKNTEIAVPATPATVASPAMPAKPATPPYYAGASYYLRNPKYKPYDMSKMDLQRKQAIDDMLNEGIIKTRDNLSFKLSTDEFIVNGKKQPEDVYQRYRAKYVKITGHNEWTWYYNYDTAQHKETSSITDSDKN